MQEMREYAEIE